ncbi:MAG: aldehyde dehydrogenase family protein, partial [Actinomycetota bacterium]|nr:aldehyde dehydrogenase family protein [Actinomycetota bacterium]
MSETLDRADLYVDGAWSAPRGRGLLPVHEAATEQVMATVPDGTKGDLDRAVAAAYRAFHGWSTTSVPDRAFALRAIADGLAARAETLATTISREVGTPLATSERVQVGLGVSVFRSMADVLEQQDAEERIGNSLVLRVPVGIVGAITPWNYPLYQLAAKVAAALAAGCTAVVKPSTVAPLAAFALADVVHAVGLPAGVLNVVSGRGTVVGEAMAEHEQIDLVSLT